jgi:hypothetical protein
MLWVNINDVSVNEQHLWYFFGGSSDIRTYAGQLRACAGSNCVNIGAPISGNWHHVAMVVNGTSWTYFLDGVKKAQGNYGYGVSSFSDDWSLRIGSAGYAVMNGKVDEILMYNEGLSESEIQNIYCSQGGSGVFC